MNVDTFKQVKEIIDQLGIGLNQLIRWSFLGIFALILLLVFDFESISQRIKLLSPIYTLIMVLIVSVGLYAVHRSLIIWLHHFLGTLIFLVVECRTCSRNSTSPTRWLGAAHKVRFGYRMLAYRILRNQEKLFPDKKERDVAHAVNGLIVMFFEGFLVAGVLVWQYQQEPHKITLILFVLAGISLFASYPMAWFQHSEECLLMKKKNDDVGKILKDHCVPMLYHDDKAQNSGVQADSGKK